MPGIFIVTLPPASLLARGCKGPQKFKNSPNRGAANKQTKHVFNKATIQLKIFSLQRGLSWGFSYHELGKRRWLHLLTPGITETSESITYHMWPEWEFSESFAYFYLNEGGTSDRGSKLSWLWFTSESSLARCPRLALQGGQGWFGIPRDRQKGHTQESRRRSFHRTYLLRAQSRPNISRVP